MEGRAKAQPAARRGDAMQRQPPTPDDDETEQGADDETRTSSPFSSTRANRIRRSGSPRISGAIPGRDPLPGSTPATPPSSASAAAQAAPIRRPSGPRTYAHLMAG